MSGNKRLQFEIHITEVSSGEVANYLEGYVEIGDRKIPFTAIAYGRVGGQNVSPEFDDEAVRSLRELGLDVEEFTVEFQRRLVEGRIVTHASPPVEPPP